MCKIMRELMLGHHVCLCQQGPASPRAGQQALRVAPPEALLPESMPQLSSRAYRTNCKYGQHRDLPLVTTFCTVYGRVMTKVITVL